MCYFQYLEQNQFIQFVGNKQYKSYIFAQALETGASDFEESLLILLEMLRIYFPAGEPIDATSSHAPFKEKHSPKVPDADRQSITLLSRVFSLFHVKNQGKTQTLNLHHLDADLALFTTYAQTLRHSMRFVFQTILYRLFREDRYNMNMKNFRDAVEQLAFQKDDTQSLGLLLKSVLLRSDLSKPYPSAKFQGSIYDEFGIDAQ